MRSFVVAGIVASMMLALASAPLDAQEHAGKKAPAPTSVGLVIAPSKPVVAPNIGSRSDAGATPAGPRSANAKTVSVSARQAAEQTIAALVAAMKNLPKRPPAPPESRTSRAQRAAGANGQALDAPSPINYHVTWPATPPEPFLGRRVELDWPGRSAGPVPLRWNEPPSN